VNDTVTTAYTLDAETGVVTFDDAPAFGVIIRWSGTYDLPMRFAAQEMPTDLVQIDRFANALTLVEDRGSAAVTPGVAEETIPLTVVSRLPFELAEGSLFGPVHRLLVLSGEDEVTERIDVEAGTRLTAVVGYRSRPWTDIQCLLAFFWGRRGRYASFQVHDPSDYTALTATLSGVGTGTATMFPVRKAYSSGATTEYRRIYRPVSAVQVYLDGVLQTSGYTLNTTRGEITFTTPPANGVEVAAICEMFDTLVRFDTDTLDITLDTPHTASITGLELLAVTDEPVALAYQSGQVGRLVASVAGCGVPGFAPPAPVPLALEFGHSTGPGTNTLQFRLGNEGSLDFYRLLNGINLFTAGIVFSHASAGVLIDLGGPDNLGPPEGGSPPWGGPRFAPWFRLGLAASDTDLGLAAVPVSSSHLTVYGRAGSGGSLPYIQGDPCDPFSRAAGNDSATASDNLGVITGKDGNELGPMVGGVVPDVMVLIVSICVATATLYCSGSQYGKTILSPNPLTPTWFEFYNINDDGAGCWVVTRGPTPIWIRQQNQATWLREAVVGGWRADNYVSYAGGGKFYLYELLLQRNLLTVPLFGGFTGTPPPGADATILAIHQAMLRYFLFRYQLGVLPTYTGEGVLAHWTNDTLQGSPDAVMSAPWVSSQGGMQLVNTAVGLTTSSPVLRVVPKPAIALERDLRLFNGSSVLTGKPLTTPVGG
jgi:uncharacterized protein (TIGR02217 family)